VPELDFHETIYLILLFLLDFLFEQKSRPDFLKIRSGWFYARMQRVTDLDSP